MSFIFENPIMVGCDRLAINEVSEEPVNNMS